MNYETWKSTYKRTDGFNSVLNGEGFEEILFKFFEERSFAFYMMAEKSYFPVYLLHGLLVSTSGNFTPLFRVTKNHIEKKYGEGTVDFVFGSSDQFGQYVLFFADKEAIDSMKKRKLETAQCDLYRTCSSFCEKVGGNL